MPEAKIQLPEGMTMEEFMKVFESFQKQRVAGKDRDKSIRIATQVTIAAHKAEYDKNLELAKAGKLAAPKKG
jgi:hypothetical protein